MEEQERTKEKTPCPFCQTEVPELTGEHAFDYVGICPQCGAKYWLETVDNLESVFDDVPILLNLTEEQVERGEWECRLIRGYDTLVDFPGQPEEEGIEVCMVFARLRIC
jgi:hypothetical protein